MRLCFGIENILGQIFKNLPYRENWTRFLSLMLGFSPTLIPQLKLWTEPLLIIVLASLVSPPLSQNLGFLGLKTFGFSMIGFMKFLPKYGLFLLHI